MRLHFCISDGDRHVFHGDMIIVIRVFILILPLLNEIVVVQYIKIPLFPTMTLCFKAAVNMGYKHALTLINYI